MSTRRGANANQRDRAQKHKNRIAFKNDLHDKTPKIKFLNNLHIAEVCEHCKAVIEWKIKYKKYKPLTKPKTCTKCGQRNIRKAYYVNCTDCALKLRCCAKCNKSADDVHILPPAPTTQEQMKLDSEMSLLLKTLPERKRRSFMRYMKKGKKKDKTERDIKESDDDDEEDESDSDLDGQPEKPEGGEEGEVPRQETIPYTKDELLKKLEELKLALASDDVDGFDDDDFFGSDLDDEDDDSGEEEEEEEDDDDEEEEEDVSDAEDQKNVKGVTFAKGVKK